MPTLPTGTPEPTPARVSRAIDSIRVDRMSRTAAVRLALLAGLATAAAVLIRMLRGPETPVFTTPSVARGLLAPSPPTPDRADGSPPGAGSGEQPGVPTESKNPRSGPDPTEPRPEPATDLKPNPPGERWEFPVEGSCPAGHPIKAKLRSGIYHLPGMLAYERTIPDRCYAIEVDAEADGLRRAKR